MNPIRVQNLYDADHQGVIVEFMELTTDGDRPMREVHAVVVWDGGRISSEPIRNLAAIAAESRKVALA